MNAILFSCLRMSRGTGFVAGAHFRKVRYRFRGRRSTFARCGADFAAGAALSQGRVQILWQAQHFRQGQVQISRQAQHFRKGYGTDFSLHKK